MKRKNVQSSVLKSVGYNKRKQILETEIVTDEIYEYYKVPPSEYINLMQAASLGTYYNKHIKKYAYKRIK